MADEKVKEQKTTLPCADITPDLAHRLIVDQFPEYAHLPITSVEVQGHDNRTYRLGNDLLIRMPSAEAYALKVPKKQEFLPKIAPYLTVNIPVPIKMGAPSKDYPYPFSIYKWLLGTSVNLLTLNSNQLKDLAFDLAKFLKEPALGVKIRKKCASSPLVFQKQVPSRLLLLDLRAKADL